MTRPLTASMSAGTAWRTRIPGATTHPLSSFRSVTRAVPLPRWRRDFFEAAISPILRADLPVIHVVKKHAIGGPLAEFGPIL